MKRFLEKSLKIYEHEIPRFVWLAGGRIQPSTAHLLGHCALPMP